MTTAPLRGILVLDLSRMLPGAVLARQLLDLGARVVKVEEPGRGDPLRHMPPLIRGAGAGWAALLRGAESVELDLLDAGDAGRLRRLARRADVLVESFRPGRMDGWSLGEARLRAGNPALVWCALSSFGPDAGDEVGHDLNFVGLAGALETLGGRVPGIQLADVGSALLAATGIVAALLERHRTGRGARVEQPLLSGAVPFMAWSWADAAAGGGGAAEGLLTGRAPAYRTYACADGLEVAVGALEPKFWVGLCELLELPALAGAGLEVGHDGVRAAAEVAGRFATRTRAEWLEAADGRGLPLTPVHRPADAPSDPLFERAGLIEATPVPGGGELRGAGPFVPSLGRSPDRPAPGLGEHTEAVLAELLGEAGG